MIINGVCNDVKVLYTKSDTNKETGKSYYKACLWFVKANESGEISCTEDVFKKCSDVAGNLDVSANFQTAYNTNWKSFQLTSVDFVGDKKK